MPATRIQTSARTDGEIAREIRRKLRADFEVPDDLIAARVAEGVVTLEGVVARDLHRKAAEICVGKVRGVRGIANRIVVVEPAAL